MPLYKVTVKLRKHCNGQLIEPGMQVEVASAFLLAPTSGPCGDLIQAAFTRVYGVDLKGMNALNSAYLTVEKIK